MITLDIEGCHTSALRIRFLQIFSGTEGNIEPQQKTKCRRLAGSIRKASRALACSIRRFFR